MKKFMSFSAVALMAACLSLQSCKTAPKEAETTGSGVQVTQLYDYVFDLGTYENIDEKAGLSYIQEFTNDGKKFMPAVCSAVAKVINGEMVLGRNLDYYIDQKGLYTGRVEAADGLYATKFLACTSPLDCRTYEKEGMDSTIWSVMPYLATDVMNSEGLYIEMNMRFGTPDENGNNMLACTATNPGKERVSILSLPQYVVRRCKNVEEAVKLIQNEVDWYSLGGSLPDWALCFMIGDAEGHYGLMEFGLNKAIWTEGQPIQTNFYVNEACKKVSNMACGLGRYEVLAKNLPSVNSEKEMHDLMRKVYYSQVYEDPLNAQFDCRTEFVNDLVELKGDSVHLTSQMALDETNRDFMNKYMLQKHEAYAAHKDAGTLRDDATFWATSISLVANCTKKTLDIVWWENEEHKTNM